jgi:hypothetical protein
VIRVGQNRIGIYTVYDRIFVDFRAKNAVYTPYIYIYIYYVWFWPTLLVMAGNEVGWATYGAL